jgi:hypothetical protein
VLNPACLKGEEFIKSKIMVIEPRRAALNIESSARSSDSPPSTPC